MDSYESAVGCDVFSYTKLYSDVDRWIQSMYSNGKYFEDVELSTGKKQGDGSAGYFLPLFWILGIV